MADSDPIVIVGMGGLFPGAADIEGFWQNILAARSCAREVPEGRWLLSADEAYDPRVGPVDKVYSKRGCFIDPFSFDPGGELDIDSELLDSLDPLFHIVLHAGVQAFNNAFRSSKADDRRRIGVMFGNIALPTERSSALAREYLGRSFEESVPGLRGVSASARSASTASLNSFVAGLPGGVLAKALRLGGGCMTLDAACASSLYALKHAVDELRAGRVDVMLAGGSSRPDCLYTQMGFSQLRALSPSGRCAPFDRNGDGLVVGEGAGFFVLKRCSDALRDKDHIHAVIRGIGLSNDIHGSLLAPSSEGQLRAMRQAYERAGWSPGEVDLIECHATGTPVGDAVEFESLKTLWAEAGARRDAGNRCVIGGVKSNVGHLLTGAGAAGLMKALMALRDGTLPPTANFVESSEKLDLGGSPFEVLTGPRAWERRSPERPYRAAVSAFGFGGINAHVLLEEWKGDESVAATVSPTAKSVAAMSDAAASSGAPIAIVGMAAHFGPWESLRAFQERVLGGGVTVDPCPPRRWWGLEQSGWFGEQGLGGRARSGYFIENLQVPIDRFRIPPRELEEMLPQQLLMLMVASEALDDARMDWSLGVDAGIFIGIELDPNTTNFQLRWSLEQKAREWQRSLGLELSQSDHAAWVNSLREACGPPLTANRTMGALGGIVASRLAREFKCGGPCHTISSEETSGLCALDVAVGALRRGELKRALVGAVDLAGDPRIALARIPAADSASLIGEGAAAVVLRPLDEALRDGDRVYAVIRGTGKATPGDGARLDGVPAHSACDQAMLAAFDDAGVPSDSVAYVEGTGVGSSGEIDVTERSVWSERLSATSNASIISAGDLSSRIGHAGAATGLASLVKASLCLYQQVLPSSTALRDADLGVQPPCAWVRDRADGPRRAAVNSVALGGNCVHVVLDEAEAASHDRIEIERRQPLGARDTALFAIEGNNEAELIAGLDRLAAHTRASGTSGIEKQARAWIREQTAQPDRRLGVALLASDSGDLLGRIEEARQRVRSADAMPTVTGSPANPTRERVFHSRTPLGADGEVAFVYPGSGNQFPGMGRSLALHFPEILRRQDEENARLRSQLKSDLFWRGGDSQAHLDDVAEPRALLMGQVALGTIVTDLIRSFGVEPKAVLGYSLGESAGFFGMRAWMARDEMLDRLNASPLFVDELAGHCRTARTAWGVGDEIPIDWVIGVVNCPPEKVREIADGVDRAYLLIVNTPDECVIGGEAPAVKRLVESLGCTYLPVKGVTIAHCNVVESVARPYWELHHFDVQAPPDVRFYSGVRAVPIEVTPDGCADTILTQASYVVDFPKTVQAAHADGARIFVEMGPGGSCTRMISRILADKPHRALAACPAERAEQVQLRSPGALLHVLAQLVAERVPVDLGRLYGNETISCGHASEEAPHGKKLEVPIGDEPYRVPAPPRREETRASSVSKSPASSMAPTGAVPVEPQEQPATAPANVALSSSLAASEAATAEAHARFLRFSQDLTGAMASNLALQMSLVEQLSRTQGPESEKAFEALAAPVAAPTVHEVAPTADARIEAPIQQATVDAPSQPVALAREQCMEFAVGSIGKVLGEAFAPVDAHPTRVRLPDEPLMLVDRILTIEGEPRSMTSGRVVTEHDVLPGAWYLDLNRIPTCVAVEAGQADLFLSGYLGIDFETKGLACYRLLDAVVTFHRGLPVPGDTIHYDIHIDNFFRQGETYLFRFNFESTVRGEPLLSMKNGCAGFFTDAELAAGQGIIHTELDLRPVPGVVPDGWQPLVPMEETTYSDEQIEALRSGDLAGCFGPAFEGLDLRDPLRIPGGRMHLLDRVVSLDPKGGRYGLGQIRSEADIHPDDWFLTCHFVDDRVMPGTLMYECCMHTLRVFLMRMGWVSEQEGVAYEPVPGVASQLKCRGQVIESTKKAAYEISIKELGYRPEPYALADALMYADGKPIVEITDMSIRLTGLSEEKLKGVWERKEGQATSPVQPAAPATDGYDRKPALYDYDRILAFAVGKPSEAFGEPYRVFDEDRVIARLPGPPYQFLDRITAIDAEPWKMASGGVIEAQYDVPPDAWYFSENRDQGMPFAVLLEVALQPCGWLAAYMGSALTSDLDLSFRNLGGSAVQHIAVNPDIGTLTTTVKSTRVSSSGGMVIQHYDMEMRARSGLVYRGDTYFGFFSKQALAEQIGIRDAGLYEPDASEAGRATMMNGAPTFPYPIEEPYPGDQMRMIDRVDLFVPDGGTAGLGFIRGSLDVDPSAWFFKAHFYQDPVCPGSLGLESFLQLMCHMARSRWGSDVRVQAMALGEQHKWLYRGQVIPPDDKVAVRAEVTEVDEARRLMKAAGFLEVDGRVIYQMTDFALNVVS